MNTRLPVYALSDISTSGRNDVEVKRFGAYLKIHPNLHKPHKHAFYHIVLFTEGGGTHTIDFDAFPVEAGQIYFMIPGQVHSWNFSGQTDGYVINFAERFFSAFLNSSTYLNELSFFSGSAHDGVIRLPEKLRDEVHAAMEKLVIAAESKQPRSADYMRVLLLQIFIRIDQHRLGQVRASALSAKHILLKNFLRMADREYVRLRQPRDYAAQLAVTPNHLNALCRDVLGRSAGDVIRERIALEARRMLINLELSVGQIGYHLGFKDNAYFSRFFRKQTGLTPEQFRKEKLIPYETER